MRLIVLKGSSDNNVLREFADSTAEGLVQCGNSVDLVDLIGEDPLTKFNSLINQDSVDGIVSFNGILGDVIPAEFRIPFLAWLVDSPHYHFKRIVNNKGQRHTLCPSNHHLNFIKQAKVNTSSSVMLAGARNYKNKLKDQCDRKHTLLVAASWMGEPQKFWESLPNEIAKKVSINAVEILDSDPMVDVFAALRKAAEIAGIKFEFNDSWMYLATEVQSFIRKKDRLEHVKALAQTGIPLTIVGNGWEQVLDGRKNISFVNSINNDQITDYYADAKIVLNLNASNGACERLFDAMVTGACVISDESSTLRQYFKDGKDLRFFDRRKRSSLVNSVEYVLNNNKFINMSARAKDIVIKEHMWINRANAISEIFKKINQKKDHS